MLATNLDYLIHRHAPADTQARAARSSCNFCGKAWISRSGVVWKAPRVECDCFGNSLWAFGDTAALTITLCGQVTLSYRINHGALVIIVNDDTHVRPPVVCCTPHRLSKRQNGSALFFFFFFLSSAAGEIHSCSESIEREQGPTQWILHILLYYHFLMKEIIL